MAPVVFLLFCALGFVRPDEIRNAELLKFLEDYNRAEAPPDKPFDVRIGTYAHNIVVDVDSRTMEVQMYLRQSWQDNRLKPLLDGAIKKVLDPKLWEEIWIPDIFFRNAKKVESFDVPHDHVLLTLNSTGHVWFVRSLLVTFSCPTLVYTSMFGATASCPIMFESYSYTKDTFHIKWLDSPVDISPDVSLPGFTLLEKILYDCSQNYTAGSFPCLEVRFILKPDATKRIPRATPYVSAFILVVLSWIGFWLDGDEVTQRLGLGLIIAVITTMISFLGKLYIKSENALGKFEIYMTFCTVLVLATLIEYFVAYVLLGMIPRKLALARKKEISETQPPASSRVARIMDVACGLILFPVIFLLFNIAFWAMNMRV